MYVIGHAVDLDRHTVVPVNDATHLFVKLRFPRFRDQGNAILCSVYDVEKKVCI